MDVQDCSYYDAYSKGYIQLVFLKVNWFVGVKDGWSSSFLYVIRSDSGEGVPLFAFWVFFELAVRY